jgi:hypothetical protein
MAGDREAEMSAITIATAINQSLGDLGIDVEQGEELHAKAVNGAVVMSWPGEASEVELEWPETELLCDWIDAFCQGFRHGADRTRIALTIQRKAKGLKGG